MDELIEKIWQRIVEISKKDHVVFVICLLALLYIPLRVGMYNYMPIDDAKRHVAKVVSGREWPEILVMRDAFKAQDHNAGWHFILNVFHTIGIEKEGLMFLSWFGLFYALTITGLIIYRKQPLAWMGALFCTMLIQQPQRWMTGRPYLLTATILVVLLALWKTPDVKRPKRRLVFTTGLIALAGWVHGAWYLFAFLPLTLFMSGRIRCAITAGVAWLGGSVVAGVLTGQPFQYLVLQVSQTLASTGFAPLQRLLVSEFLPVANTFALVVLASLLCLHFFLKLPRSIIYRNPAFWLILTGWTLGTVNGRFWYDWGLIAFLCLTAQILREAWLHYEKAGQSIYRPTIGVLTLSALVLIITSNIGDRWSNHDFKDPLRTDDPEHQGWLPEPGGILYSDSMVLYYDTFYANPNAPWRYILGHEPALMPESDLNTLRQIQFYKHTLEHFYNDWVEKMTHKDRLILKQKPYQKPNVAGLEWKYVAYNTWSGRLPDSDSADDSM